MKRVLASCAAVSFLAGCGAGTTEKRPQLSRVLRADDAHLISAWTRDAVVYGQAAARPGDKQPWAALYRIAPAAGAVNELLARNVYSLTIQRIGQPRGQPFTYLLPRDAGPPRPCPGTECLKSLGSLWLVRPGEPPREVVTEDAALLAQPAVFSPDGSYLLSYGHNTVAGMFSIELTDLGSGGGIGITRRIAQALSVVVPRWFGFGGASTGPRYLGLPNLEDMGDMKGLRPFAVFRLDQAGSKDPPVPLPGRMVGLLPDGRAVVEGDKDLQAAVLAPGGEVTVLARGPVAAYSAFVAGGVPYFIRGGAGPGNTQLLRVRGAATELVLDGATGFFSVAASERLAYLSSRDQGLVAVDLGGSRGQATVLAAEPLKSRRALPGDALYFTTERGTFYWAPGRAAPLAFPAGTQQVVQVSQGRFAVLVDEGSGAVLRLLDRDGRTVGGTGGAELAPGVSGIELMDSLDAEPDGSALVFTVPGQNLGGLYRQDL